MLEGQPERAGQLLGAAETLRKAIHAPLEAADLPLYERTVAAARAALGEPAYAGAWAKGREMTFEEAIALAIGD
jgi:hypothetical protein